MTHRRTITRYEGDMPVVRQRFGRKALLALSPELAVLLSAFLAGAVAAMLIMSVFILAITVLVLGLIALGAGRHMSGRCGPTRQQRRNDMDRG
ncbi:hypothetical protein M3P21_03680 [Ruegeria sp. 2012CJ41-6]|uniref:Uncharacterized protein n=1 Tax=Ruegeria spongiae TaxID=2942209 RepID=A0ABT0PYI1_9RHOB|nr:hypothetical protein [Ruegeria spongiae]MCL6282621.1 hypothetical protein [Ruegeria spongiae]